MKRGIMLMLLTFALLAHPLAANGGSVPELVSQLRQGMAWIQTTMDPENACTTEDAWYLRRFWLRLRPKATITLPGVKLTIVPEVEILLEADYPDGWGTYKP